MQELLTLEEFIKRGLLKEGSWFTQKLNPSIGSKLDTALTGFERTQIVKNQAEEFYSFRYTEKINDGSVVKLIGEPSSSGALLKGIVGSENISVILNTICKIKFSVPNEIEAHSISFEEHSQLPPDFQYGTYLLPKAYFKAHKDISLFGVLYSEKGVIDKHFTALNDNEMNGVLCEIRPVISLHGSNIRILTGKKHTGTSLIQAYEIVVLKDSAEKSEDKENENIAIEDFLKRTPLKDGTWFRLHLNPQVHSELGKDVTGYTKVQEIKNQPGETLLFRYVKGLNPVKKELVLLGEPTDYTLYLSGKKGYEVGPITINSCCNIKFCFKDQIEARTITWEEQDELPQFLQYGEYWLPETYCNGKYYGIQCVIGKNLTYVCLYMEKNVAQKKANSPIGCDCNSVRPIISLYGKKVRIIVGETFDGMTSDTAYDIITCE